MAKKKKVPIESAAKGTLPLDSRLQPGELVSTVTEQLANAQACADYPNQPTVQAACTALKGSLGTYSALMTNLSNAGALVLTLESQRDVQGAAVRRDHTTLQTAINSVSAGLPKSLLAWGATVAGHTLLPVTSAAPLEVAGKALGGGLVRAQCKRDEAAKCYLIQVGTDPNNLAAWPQPMLANGCRHTFPATPGQKLYFRMAVQRRGKSGLGVWSERRRRDGDLTPEVGCAGGSGTAGTCPTVPPHRRTVRPENASPPVRTPLVRPLRRRLPVTRPPAPTVRAPWRPSHPSTPIRSPRSAGASRRWPASWPTWASSRSAPPSGHR